MGTQADRYNLVVIANEPANDATVLLDDRALGNLTKSRLAGLNCPVFWANLPDGLHEIEVIKPGFKAFKKKFEMATEAFVSVNLVPIR